MKVKECKIIKALVCREDDSVFDAAKLLLKNNERHIYLVNRNNEPTGIISTTDITHKVVALGKDYKTMKAKEIMSVPIYVVADENDELVKIYMLMEKNNSYACPVVSKGKITGTLLMHDALNLIINRGDKNDKI